MSILLLNINCGGYSIETHTNTSARLIIIGAGPIGLELAANCKRLGLNYLQFDAGSLANTIYHWPRNTPFFSSPERVGIAGVPVHSSHQGMITGEEYISYLRSVVEHFNLEIYLGHRVLSAERLLGDGLGGRSRERFRVEVEHKGERRQYSSEFLVLATGNMHSPQWLGVPGEDSEHVDHYYADVHKYFRQRLLIVGGRNSAVEAAIRCWRAGVDVTLMHRQPALNEKKLNSRYNLEINILINKGKVTFIPNAEVQRIHRRSVEYYDRVTSEIQDLPADFVMICAGFEKDLRLLRQLGIRLDSDLRPEFNTETMETNVPNLFLAGTAASGGTASYKIFVGTSHIHVQKIIKKITGQEAIIGDYGPRVYPFSNEDIEPVEGK